MTDFHDKPYHFKSDLVGDPNKPQEGSHKTSSAFVSNRYIHRVIDTDAFSQQNGGTSPGHILQDREMIDTASER